MLTIMQCDVCGYEWEVEGETLPLVCPECGGTCKIKPPAPEDPVKIRP